MYPIIRYRSEVDERHTIRNPHGPHPRDMDVWANTLVKTRIPDLYRTLIGVPGHAKQIENEIKRLSKFQEGASGEIATKAIEISKFIRHSLNKAKKDAEERSCSYIWHAYLYSLSAA